MTLALWWTEANLSELFPVPAIRMKKEDSAEWFLKFFDALDFVAGLFRRSRRRVTRNV